MVGARPFQPLARSGHLFLQQPRCSEHAQEDAPGHTRLAPDVGREPGSKGRVALQSPDTEAIEAHWEMEGGASESWGCAQNGGWHGEIRDEACEKQA